MQNSRSRSTNGGRSPALGSSSSFGQSQFGSRSQFGRNGSFASAPAHIPPGSSSNEATAMRLAQQAQQERQNGLGRQAQEIRERGTSPFVPALNVSAEQRNGRGRSPNPNGSNNSLSINTSSRSFRAGSNGLLSLNVLNDRSFPDAVRAPRPPSPTNTNTSYSYDKEDHRYDELVGEEAEAARAERSRSQSVTSRRSKRNSGITRDDDAYRDGDYAMSDDEDDNPDRSVGVAATGRLRRRHRSASQLDHSGYVNNPNARKGRFSTVPEEEGEDQDEGLEQDGFYETGVTAASPEPEMEPELPRPAARSMKFQVVQEGSTLPQSFRQPTWWDDVVNHLQYWGNRAIRYAQEQRGIATAGAIIVLGVLFILLWSIRTGSSAPSIAPKPIPTDMAEMASRFSGLEAAYGKLQSDSAVFDERLSRTEKKMLVVTDLQRGQAAVLDDNRRMKEQIGAVMGRVDKVEGKVARLDERVATLERTSQAIDDGSFREALMRILPSIVPVIVNKKGLYDIDDAFVPVLKRLLYSTGDLEQEVRHFINQGVVAETGKHFEQWHPDSQRLDERLQQMMTLDQAETFVTREEFATMFENKARELFHERKVVSEKSTSGPTTVKLLSSKGEDLTPIVQAVVDASIVRYSNDKLGMTDYALFGAGARVIEENTSPTLRIADPSFWEKWAWGQDKVSARPPHVALHPDTTIGQCWAFAGPDGTLAILLSKPDVIVDAVTIDHISKELTEDVSSAPKDVEVWATIEGEDNLEKARRYLEVSPYKDVPLSMEQAPDTILLAKFVYDINSATPFQTFPVPKALSEMGISTRITVFRFLSNWGGDHTCIYRTRVHGKTSEYYYGSSFA